MCNETLIRLTARHASAAPRARRRRGTARASAHREATVRGLRFQRAPHSEGKLVRCGRGALYDVVIDLRPDSVSFRRWQAFILNAENMLSLYIPPGCAHGFQTLEDDTETLYQMTVAYAPDHAAGVRYDDPSLSIPWPLPVSVISQRDFALPRGRRATLDWLVDERRSGRSPD
jgi:dTDP-4-dehydrorhamnose 3,5-epimerase